MDATSTRIPSTTKRRRTSGQNAAISNRKRSEEGAQGSIHRYFGREKTNGSQSSGSKTPLDGNDENHCGSETLLPEAALTEEPVDIAEPPQKTWRDGKPYYQRVFDEALTTVITHESHLLDDADMEVIDRYKRLNADGQKLFVRLFSRDCKWIRLSALKYPEIHLDDAYSDLRKVGLVQTDVHFLHDLLNIMSGIELKAFSKECQLITPLQARWTKNECIEAIISHTSTQTLLVGNPLDRTRSRVMKILGPLLKTEGHAIEIFERVMIVYFRSLDLIERPMTAGILSEVERWNFPLYEVERFCDMFATREASVEYCEALRLHVTIEKLAESRKNAECLQHLDEIQALWESLISAADSKGSTTEPTSYFLCQFTPLRVYTVLLTRFALDILPTLHHHSRAMTLLHLMLSQRHYGWGSRGKWWDQLSHLTLNHLETAADRLECALELCVEAIRDPLVRAGWLVKIRRRMERVARKMWEQRQQRHSEHNHGVKRGTGKKGGKKLMAIMSGWEELVPGDVRHRLVDLTIKEPTQQVCEANKIPDGTTGRKSRWVGEPPPSFDSAASLPPAVGQPTSPHPEIVSVEDIALTHYAARGYTGLHVENTLFHHLFGLLLYDILYTTPSPPTTTTPPHPHVFQTRFQTHPLDFFTDAFYQAREPAIVARCEQVASWSRADLVAECQRLDTTLRDQQIRGVGLAWAAFDQPTLLTVVACMNPAALSAVLKCMAESYKDHCGGLPDLVLWNPTANNTITLCEVKGPGDRLSEKQIMWCDVLLQAGWDVHICKVVERTEGKGKPRASAAAAPARKKAKSM
ncbi:hypothetical protein DFJ77DRAFT_507600 [Powellomyces hirtus]|nr:hypothetical protein DFJ77DRAFT_507600 [Powellomyces hirtus]